MAQKVYFDGILHVEPTSRSKIIGGGGNRAGALATGNVCIIDTGIGAAYGGGLSAVDGSGNARDIDEFVYEFGSLAAMREFVKGGKLWDVLPYLFRPASGQQGATTVFYIRAAQMSAATINITLASGGDFDITAAKDVGLVGNGQEHATTNNLELGYALRFRAGTADPTKFVMEIWRGTYKGVDAVGNTFEGINITNAALNPKLVVSSDEIETVDELLTWASSDEQFKTYFSMTKNTAGAFAAGDLTTLAGNNLLAGGTETYSGTHLDTVLDLIGELDCNLFLATEGGSLAAGTNNVKILTHIASESKHKKFLVIGGGSTKSQFASQSTTPAATLNSPYSILVHGGLEIRNPDAPTSNVFITRDSIYTAALVCGRLAGVEPQVPLTHRNLLVSKLQHNPTPTERKNGINSGVVMLRKDAKKGYIVNMGVNTLQNNDGYILPDGTSPEISVERIKAQMNREIQEGGEQFLGEYAFTVDKTVVESYVLDYLEGKRAIEGERDGLILSYQNIEATRTGTVWNVTYEFTPNGPINFFFATGTIIDDSITN